MTCPKCGQTEIRPEEAFCPACGAKLGMTADEKTHAAAHTAAEKAAVRARGWILAVAILTWIGAVVFYFIQQGQVEDQIKQVESQSHGMSAEDRDRVFKQSTGMTFDEAVEHDRGQVRLNLYVNIGLGVFFLLMWLWSKKNLLAAAVVSLLAFLTAQVVYAINEPESLMRGVYVKVAVIIALSSAIAAAFKVRQTARAVRPAP